MTALSIQVPYQIFADSNGTPLDNGYVWIGATNLDPRTNPINVYFDAALTQVAPNPLRTLNGYVYNAGSPAQLYIDGVNFSIRVEDKKSVLVYSFPSGSGISPNASGIVYTPAGTGAVATTVQSKLRESVSVLDFYANGVSGVRVDPTGVVDSTLGIQGALNSGAKRIYMPGAYKITTALNVPAGVTIYGDGFYATTINFYGCNGFLINGDGVTIEKMAINSYSVLGVAFPKTFVAVWTQGTAVTTINRFKANDLFIRGFSNGVLLAYAWSSLLNNVQTETCEQCVRLFGQSVNNTIDNCNLVADTGYASIYIAKDGATSGEGLMIANTLTYGGSYSVFVEQFLALEITNCILDVSTVAGIYATDSRNMKVSNSWIYTLGTKGVQLNALGTIIEENITLANNDIIVVNAAGTGVYVGDANYGVSVIGGSITIGGTSIGVDLAGVAGLVDNVHFVNTGSGLSVKLTQITNTVGLNTGVTTTTGNRSLTPTETTYTASDVSGAGLVLTQNLVASAIRTGNIVSGYFDVTFPATADASIARISLPYTPATKFYPLVNVDFKTIAYAVNVAMGTIGITFTSATSNAFLTNANMTGARVSVKFSYIAS